MIAAENFFYEQQYASVHRGLYPLAAEATALYEQCRSKIGAFIGAQSTREIVLTSGTTASINLVARGYAAAVLQPGDVILAGASEHHANLVPWQQICLRTQARLKIIPMDEQGILDRAVFEQLLRTFPVKIVAVAHISNVLGTVHPVADLVRAAHAHGAVVVVDAAQSAGLHAIHVREWGADFVAFSGHKMFGPTGTGVLYGQSALLEQMEPLLWGGEMVRSVAYNQSTFAEVPRRFEAGTPNIAGFVGLSAAIDFIAALDRPSCLAHIADLKKAAVQHLETIAGLRILGNAPEQAGILSFVLDNVHPHDIATLLGRQNICVRAGHHCAQPVMDFFGVPATTRISFSIYNTAEEVKRLTDALRQAQQFLGF